MVYNELEQGDTLSEVRVGVAPLAYTDILLRSIWAIFKIRQTPVSYYTKGETRLLLSYHAAQRPVPVLVTFPAEKLRGGLRPGVLPSTTCVGTRYACSVWGTAGRTPRRVGSEVRRNAMLAR